MSIAFAVAGYLCTGFLFHVGRKAERDPSSTRYTKAAKWHSLFVGNIACVELCEFIIWLNVLPMGGDANQDQCPIMNSIGTYGVFLFGFVNWMWLISLWAYKSSNGGNDKPTFQMYLVLGIITSLGYVLKIVLGDHWQYGIGNWEDRSRWEYNSKKRVSVRHRSHMIRNAAQLTTVCLIPCSQVVTCSFNEEGTYPHLHWRFNMAQVPYLPSGFAWFAVGLLPLFFYKPRGTALVTSLWGSSTYIIPKLLLPAEETMSMY